MRIVFSTFIFIFGVIFNITLFDTYEDIYNVDLYVINGECLNEEKSLVPLNAILTNNTTHYKIYAYTIYSTGEIEVVVNCSECINYDYEIKSSNENIYQVLLRVFIEDYSCLNSKDSIDLQISFKLKKVNLE